MVSARALSAWVAGGGHDRVVVVETDQIHHHVGGDGVIAADERFRAAGAFKIRAAKRPAWRGLVFMA